MGTNAYESLQTLSRILSSVPLAVNQLGVPSSVAEYKLRLQASRDSALASIPLTSSALSNEKLEEIIGVPLFEFYADCALATNVASILQRSLSEMLQGRSRSQNLPQEYTHLLVDLWGQVEAFKALYDFSIRHVAEVEGGSGEKRIKGISLRAQCRVLSTGLEQLLLTLAMKIGDHSSLASVAELVDWTVTQLRAPKYEPLREAINDELYGLVT